MIDVETESTFRFIDAVKGAGFQIADIRKDLAHMLASAMFNGMFEVVMHDLSRAGRAAIYPEIAGIFQRRLG